jgi:hypothetical protein
MSVSRLCQTRIFNILLIALLVGISLLSVDFPKSITEFQTPEATGTATSGRQFEATLKRPSALIAGDWDTMKFDKINALFRLLELLRP